ncbi:MAG: adenylyl-sulfate kinase [Hyphomicrobiaceae bacterium]
MQTKHNLYAAESKAAHVVVIGPADAASAIRGAIARRGLGDELTVSRTAGRLTSSILEDCAHAGAVVIATARDQGFSAETRRECLLAWGLGVPTILAVETATDAAAMARVRDVGAAFAAWAHRLGGTTPTACVALTPDGDDVVDTLLEQKVATASSLPPLRVWIRTLHAARGVTTIGGILVAGRPAAGQKVAILPSGAAATITAVDQKAGAQEEGRFVHLVLDAEIRAPAEDAIMLADAQARPELADQVAAHVVWTGDHAMLPGRPYRARNGGQAIPVQIGTIKHRLDPADLAPLAARQLCEGEIGFCNLSFSTPLLFDATSTSPALGLIEILETDSDRRVGFARPQFTLRRATNIHWQALSVDKAARAGIKTQKPCCLWLTGLSGSGKSTVASLLEQRLNAMGRHTYTLDGDNVRHGLNRDLGFTEADRVENIRRVAEVARLFVDAGLIVIASFISPFRAEREMARNLLAPGEFLEIFVDTPLAVCEARDAKGLYRKARAGALKNFTGIDSPYEAPDNPEITLSGGHDTAEQHVETVLRELTRKGII